jgi:hypothetical protein
MGQFVPYDIISFRASERRAVKCSGNLVEARRAARESVKSGANRAEVRDAFGDLMFEWPETGLDA